jgi:hypothetical protein
MAQIDGVCVTFSSHRLQRVPLGSDHLFVVIAGLVPAIRIFHRRRCAGQARGRIGLFGSRLGGHPPLVTLINGER